MIVQQGQAGITRQQASTNTAAQLSLEIRKANKVDDDAGAAQAVHVSVEGAAIRYAFGVDPTTGGLGHLLSDGETIRIAGADNVEALKVVSAEADTAATLHATPEFGKGTTVTP